MVGNREDCSQGTKEKGTVTFSCVLLGVRLPDAGDLAAGGASGDEVGAGAKLDGPPETAEDRRNSGTVTTRTLRLPGGSLFVNAGVRGELRAELLDSEGRVLPGYSADDCVPIRSDGRRQMIRWNRVFQPDSLRDRAVRLRFHMREADLYAFWFQPHAGGSPR